MENDQTVFQNPNVQSSNNPVSQNPINVTPEPNFQTTQPPAAPSSPEPPNKRKISISGSKNIIKILIGFTVVLIIFLIAAFIILPFLGNKTQTGPATLTYWGLWEDSKTMQPVINDFQRQNPNIKINYVKQDIKQYRERLATRIDNGTGPDIFTFHNTWYPMLSSFLLPLPKEVISKEEFTNSFYPVASIDLIKKGAIYGIPMEIDTLAMYINKDLFTSAGIDTPKTWDDFINDARILTVKDTDGKIKTAGAALGTYDNVTHAPDIISLLFLQNGVDINNLENSSERAQSALNFYSSFATDQNNVWDNTLDSSILSFSKGNLAIFFGYSWDFFTIKSFNPSLNFEIAPVPQLPNQNVNMASYWAVGYSSKSKYQKEAALFIKYLASKKAEEAMYSEQSKERAFGEPYARIDLGQALKDNPIIYPFISQSSSARSSFFADSTNDNGLNQQLNSYLGNAVNSMLSGSSVQSSFDTLSKGVSQVMLQYEGQK